MMENGLSVILMLHQQEHWGIVSAELKRIDSQSQYISVEGSVRSQRIPAEDKELHQLAILCEELMPSSLYVRHASKKVFRHEADFWASNDRKVQHYIKHIADIGLQQAIVQADEQDIPIIYVKKEKKTQHIGNRLKLIRNSDVIPIMSFCRHAEGIRYRLQLRIGKRIAPCLCKHQLTVLTYNPGMFILDNEIYSLNEGFNGRLLLPFASKEVVDIPQRMENDYFRRFIQKNVVKAEVHAEGFDIRDIDEQLHPCLKVETNVGGVHVLTLCFRYGTTEFTPDSTASGRVTLQADKAGFSFTRQMRDKGRESELMELLKQTCAKLTSQGSIRFASTSEMVGWLQQHAPKLREQGFDVVQPSEHVYYIGPVNVEQSDTWQGDWLQTNVTIVLEKGRLRIPFRDLCGPILNGEQEYMLPTGERLLIPQEWLKRYANLILVGMKKGEGFQRHRSQIPAQDESPSPTFPLKASPPAIPAGLKATLRPYQQRGFEWLWNNFEARTGCCLSDEMGLGKTIQTIALLLKYKEQTHPKAKPQPGFLFTEEEMQGINIGQTADYSIPTFMTTLVVAPTSVVHNWCNELRRFAPSLLVCNYTGEPIKRREMRKTLSRWDVVLTTYRTLLNDIVPLADIQFGIVVFDESQTFKTATSQIHQAVKRLKAQHCLALSGTPVENNLMELWSLMNVLNPNLLGESKSFQQSFITPIARQIDQERSSVLRQLIVPYFLKRTKEEVLPDLPERQDEVVVCPMTETQASMYAEELSKARNEWLDSTTVASSRNINILAAIQRLRHIANGEGKMNVVFKRLEQLRNTQHKVLIFSEYVSLLEQVGREMEQRGWQYDLLTGQTIQRDLVISNFQQTADSQFFLISLKAGGVGLNLTSADYVFILDPWWNQAAEEQAIARSHRIGQHRSVFVYRFVSENTLEQQILSLQERKQNIIDSVMPFIL